MTTKIFLATAFAAALMLFGGLFWFAEGQTINPFLVWDTYLTGVSYSSASVPNCTALALAQGRSCVCPTAFSVYYCQNSLSYFSDNSQFANFTSTQASYHLSTYSTGNTSTCSGSGSFSGSLSGTIAGGTALTGTESGTWSSTACSSTWGNTFESQVPSVSTTTLGTVQTIWNFQCTLRALCLATPQLAARWQLDMEDALMVMRSKYNPPKISPFP